MAAYTGLGNFPYWMTITNSGGVSGVAALSENIPVQPGTLYQFPVICSFATTWASGVNLSLTFYDASGAQISQFTGSQTNMTGGVIYQAGLTAGQVTAPGGSSYAVAQITVNGNPSAANPLSVYQAEVDDGNFVQANLNYTFTWTFWPWNALNSSTTLAWNASPTITGDSDSLVLDGVIELMGGLQGVQCTVPELLDANGQGPTFRITAAQNSSALGASHSLDLNAPQPTQDVVASMLLDGERPFGARASNRTIVIPIMIFGTQAGGTAQVLKAREYLMSVIDQQTWQIKWASVDTGLPMIFDCFRAMPSQPIYGFNYSQGNAASGSTIGRPNYPIALINLTIQALPYGRSDIDGVQSLSFNSPLLNGVPTVGPSTVDTFNTVLNPPPVINTPAWATIGSSNPTSVSAWNITTTGATAGNTIAVVVEAAANSIPGTGITGVTDSAGNTYKLAGSQSTGGLCWQFLYTAPVTTTLPNNGTITVTANSSGNFASVAYRVSGAWSPRVLYQGSNTASSFAQALAANEFVMAVSTAAGLGSAGGTPSGFSPTPAYDLAVAADAPFAWWKLKDAAGNTAADSSGNALTGTAANVTFASAAAPPVAGSTAAAFNGTSSAITTGYAASGLSAITVECWVQYNASGGDNSRLLGTGEPIGTHNGFGLFCASGQAFFDIGNGTTGVRVNGGTISGTGWIHLAATWTAGTAPKIYVNGSLAATGATPLSGTLTAGTTNVAVGSAVGTHLSGNLSEAAIYTTALSATQIAAHYAGTTSGNGFSSQVAWYPQPINQASLAYSVAALPNPSSLMVFAFLPVNQYWNQDLTTPPPGYIGHSVHYTPPRPIRSPYPAAVYSQTLTTPANIVGCPALSVQFGQSYDTQWPKDPKFVSNVTMAWTLTDNTGRSLNFSKTFKKVRYGTHPTVPKWTQINAPIPQGKAFNYNTVVSYSVRITNWHGSGHTGYVRMHCWLNNIVANPPTVQNAMSPRGSVYNLFSLPGSARSPVSVQCQLPASANITKEITTPSSGTWIVPPGVYQVQAEAWGGGGAGAAVNLGRPIAGGGGGGAEYAQEAALPVLPGKRVPWSLGAGGTPGQITPTVVQYSNPGLSHWTCPPNVTSVLTEVWGGGAAGGAGSGGGGGAEYGKAYVPVTPGTTYHIGVGLGGKADTGTSASQIAARQGGGSWAFGVNATWPQSLVVAQGGKTSLTGATGGGYGGTSGTVAPVSQMAVIGSSNQGAAASHTISPNVGTKKLGAGCAALLLVTVPASDSFTIADTSSQNWSHIADSSIPGAITYAYLATGCNPMNSATKITITGSLSQGATIALISMPWVVGVDVAAVTTSGTSNAPSVTSNTAPHSGDVVLAVFSSVTANTNSTPGGWTSVASVGASGLFTNLFAIQNAGTSPETATSSYAASQNWNAISLTLGTSVRSPGGRGGTSPGPSGGGGGGAGGSTGAGGVGGDSQPYIVAAGHWQTGGTGGTGSGQGGNGGAGAGTPGFPGVGTAPGGGGGGGYQTAPLSTPLNPSTTLPGQPQVNYLGGNGGNGLVQLSYQVGSGVPVNGGATTFGSVATTGTLLAANGGTSAANTSAAGGAGGTGSSNSIHSDGGSGGLNTGGSLASYITPAPRTTAPFQTLATMTYNAGANTTGNSASSLAQGVALALIESTAQVSDLAVTDSAGNIYTLQGVQAAPGGVTLYAYVANVEFPVTTSTTLTVSSATSQQYGVIWYGSPWLASGVTSGNSGSARGTSNAFSGQFGVADTSSVELELGVVLSDGSRTVSSLTQVKTWYTASTTSSLAAGTMSMAAYVMSNQGGGTGAANSGDIFSGSLSGSGNWAVLCVPLTTINQQAAMLQMDWRTGTVPGAQTSWSTSSAISAEGMIVVIGQNGSGSSVTSGPSAIADASGNTYTFKKTQALPVSGGAAWVATAPVTHALAAGTTGTMNWGTASASPNYWTAAYWVPNAVSAVDVSGASAVTGSSATVSGSYTPGNPNDQVLAAAFVNGVAVTTNPAAPFNYIDANSAANLNSRLWAAQATDEAALTASAGLASSASWALIMLGLQMQLTGTGGGAAGGPNGPGYPGVWQYGGAGHAGGGKGGTGSAGAGGGAGASVPGGGGGGAMLSVSGAQEGGQGAPGAVRLTWTPPLTPFNTLIVHSLGANTDPDVCPIVPIPITDAPNNTPYNVPSVNGLRPATFNSSYTVLLAANSWNNATSSTARQITVTINQYEYPGGPRYSVQVSRAVTPATDSVNGLLNMGEVTLPVKDYIHYNDQSYFTVSINDTDTSDRFMDVLFLDTLGQTALINIDPGQPGYGQYVNYFIDEPTADRDLGFVGASMQDRQHQISVLDYAELSGGPLYIAPGDNLFLVYSTHGAPDLSVTYAPRWYLDRLVLS